MTRPQKKNQYMGRKKKNQNSGSSRPDAKPSSCECVINESNKNPSQQKCKQCRDAKSKKTGSKFYNENNIKNRKRNPHNPRADRE